MKGRILTNKGNAGGVVLIIVGVILSVFLLGVMMTAYKNSTVGQSIINPNTPSSAQSGGYVPTQSTPHTTTPSATSNCKITVLTPEDGITVPAKINFTGYLTGCPLVGENDFVGSVGLYRYVDKELLGSVPIRADGLSEGGKTYFHGYINHDQQFEIERGYLLFKYYRNESTQGTYVRTVYF
jgi:hypothetical protein